MLDPFTLPFVQRGIVEVAVLALAAGLIGTWIVLRGLAFFSHAVGTAAFPGLVLADGLGFSAHLGAAGTAALVAAGVGWLARHERDRYDSLTALVLVAALALGVILASDVFHSGASVETLLFGSLLAIDGGDIAWAAGAGVVVVAATLAVGPRWTRDGVRPVGRAGARAALAACPTRRCSRSWRSWRWRRCRPSARCWPRRCWWCPPRPRAWSATAYARGSSRPSR